MTANLNPAVEKSPDSRFPKMVHITSSVVKGVGWDCNINTLRVVLKSGATYDYQGVDNDTYQAFISSTSPGGFFNLHIKDVFTTCKVVTSQDECSTEVTVERKLLEDLLPIINLHQGALRTQKQNMVSQVELVDRKLEAAGAMLDDIAKKLNPSKKSGKNKDSDQAQPYSPTVRT